MKKIIFIMMMAMLTVTLFAVDMSAGGGVSYDLSSSTLKAEAGSDEMSSNMALSALSFGVFFDATYIQLGLDYGLTVAGTDTYEETGSSTVTEDFTDIITFLNFEIFAKYPIDMGSFVLFPIGGVEQMLNLTVEDEDGVDLKKDMTDDGKDWLNQTWIKLGVGADFPISESLYIRPMALLGYKIQSKVEKDVVEVYEDMGVDSASWNTFGFEFSVSVGYKL